MEQLFDVVNRGMAQRKGKNSGAAESTASSEAGGEAPTRDLTESDVLLEGLEVVARYRSLGLNDRSLPRELAALEAEATHYADRIGQIRKEEKVIEDLMADLKTVDRIIEKHDYKKNALIQILLDIQATKGWLPRHVLLWTGRRLGIPLTRIYAVASFYEAFSLVPQGAHTVQVCTGTACHVRNGTQLLATVSSLLGIKPGQTDPTMQFTLKTVNCLGCCALAPVMKIDDTYYGNPSMKEMKTVFHELRGKGEINA
jgi:NADH-quinone oxidoreductase subunit E